MLFELKKIVYGLIALTIGVIFLVFLKTSGFINSTTSLILTGIWGLIVGISSDKIMPKNIQNK